MSSADASGLPEEPSTSTNNAADNKKADVKNDKTFARYRSLIISECNFKVTNTENYLKRLQNLRKELNYINETDWMYESLEKKPPQQ